MNKILAYTVIAILLGTITMVIPYALLGPSYTSMTEEPKTETPSESSTFEQPETPSEAGKLDNEERTSDVVPAEPVETSGEELGETNLITESLSSLSSIGVMMIIPSFLIALGAFIYLKKRRS
jgi:hypothetical protein